MTTTGNRLNELFAREREAFGPGEDDLCGLALSGGGIRSATFNLGLLQGLARQGLLRGFHYLSTVSGGGYVGAFWSAWRSRPANRGKVFPWRESGGGRAVPDEIGHLRRFSNFLRPRLNLFSFETGRIVASVVAALVPSLLAALAAVVLVVLG
jgi:predicted acylesterase/phospholipase RssA